jgi:hypothetical protein
LYEKKIICNSPLLSSRGNEGKEKHVEEVETSGRYFWVELLTAAMGVAE